MISVQHSFCESFPAPGVHVPPARKRDAGREVLSKNGPFTAKRTATLSKPRSKAVPHFRLFCNVLG